MEKEMTLVEFLDYAKEQVAKASAEDEAGRKARGDALGKAWDVAKGSFFANGEGVGGTGSAKFTLYVDPDQAKPTEKETDPKAAAVAADAAAAGRTVAQKADADDEAQGWPSDMNTSAFLEKRAPDDPEWGADPR